MINALAGLGDVYRSLDRPAEAEATFVAAVAQQQATGDERSLKHTMLNLGGLYHAQNRLVEAEQAYGQALALASRQGDTRIEAFALLNLGKAAALQENWPMARSLVELAEQAALAGNYRDCMASVHQVLGDLERLAPQPDASRILQHYTEALAYAADFNQSTLDQILNYLRELWSAHAEDGYGDEVLWFCRSIVALWQEIGLAEEHPEVIEVFKELAASVADD